MTQIEHIQMIYHFKVKIPTDHNHLLNTSMHKYKR